MSEKRFAAEICPGDFISDATPLTEEKLLSLIEQAADRFDVRLALGNLLFRADRWSEAAMLYSQALTIDPSNAECLCNLGITYGRLGRIIRAIACLRRASLIKPDLVLCQLSLARLAAQRGDEDLVRAAYERVLEQLPTNEEALIFFARQSEAQGQEREAVTFYHRLLVAHPNSRVGRNRLAFHEFQRGLALFQQGLLEEALRSWALTQETYRGAFTDEAEIVRGLRACVKEFCATNYFEEFLLGFNAESSLTTDYYDLVTKYLFSLGALPELYVPREQINAERARWHESLAKEGDYPYLHYRLALLAALEGQIDVAIELLRKAGDLLKGKKLEQLYLPQILQFLTTLQQRKRFSADTAPTAVGDEEWNSAGFANTLEIRLWKRSKIIPPEARKWREAGFSPTEAKQWLQSGLLPAEAAIWRSTGIQDPKEARLWHRGGVTPDRALAWRSAFSLPVALAIQCMSVGFTDPGEAFSWMQVFQFPGEAFAWREQGFDPVAARRSREQGVSDPFEAKSLKVTPDN